MSETATAEQFNTVDQLIITGEPMAKNTKVTVQAIPLNKIKLGRNSRMSVSKEELSGLMQSIKEVGLLQAIGVTHSGKGYEVMYDNRRFMACSKLGMTKIPCFVHETKKEAEIDLKNLTENVQRRNLSLSEVGRYMHLLKGQNMSNGEIAIRLGVSASYARACLEAYRDVPIKYREDMEIAIRGADGSKALGKSKAKGKGKIAISVAQRIISAKKSYGLSESQTEQLFESAKSDDRFLVENTRKYAAAIKGGAKDPVAQVKHLKHVMCQFWVAADYWDQLEQKHVTEGTFKSMNALMVAILKGQKSLQIKVQDLK